MNPALLIQLIGLVTETIKTLPALKAEYEAIKAAGAATAEDLETLKARIEEMDAARMVSWAEADAALDAAAARP